VRSHCSAVRIGHENPPASASMSGDELVLLHGFVKQTQKTPNDDIALAQARWKERQDAEKQ
jgi:phage-related protein